MPSDEYNEVGPIVIFLVAFFFYLLHTVLGDSQQYGSLVKRPVRRELADGTIPPVHPVRNSNYAAADPCT